MFTVIRSALAEGALVPYIGPGVLSLTGPDCPIPASSAELVGRLIASASVPHKLRTNLTGAAQFIENFKHRKTVVAAMKKAFAAEVAPTILHRFLAVQPNLPLLVHAWYDDLPQRALAHRTDWGMVQALSQAEHYGQWTRHFRSDGTPTDDLHGVANGAEVVTSEEAASWRTLLYQPFGSVAPTANFLVSDSDFVEVLTEIDIQTPIPDQVKSIRTGRQFLFLGCRFSTQLERGFAHQITKRSSDRHWAVLPDAPTRNELRFLAQHGIERIDMPLSAFVEELTATERAVARTRGCPLIV
jgi:hypothetical protein